MKFGWMCVRKICDAMCINLGLGKYLLTFFVVLFSLLLLFVFEITGVMIECKNE